MSATRLLLVAIAALAVLAPQAPADVPVSTIDRNVPIAGYGGWTAWSRRDGKVYRLVLRAPDGTIRDASIVPEKYPFDVQLGPDANGKVVAVYSKCGKRDCDIHMLSLLSGRDKAIRGASTDKYLESTPAIWRSRLAYTVRVKGCDIPLVMKVSSHRRGRQLLRTKCLTTFDGHLAMRGDNVVVSSTDYSDYESENTFTDEVRLYSTRHRGSHVLYAIGYSQEVNQLGQVVIDGSAVTTVRYGINQPIAFLRLPLNGAKKTVLPANLDLFGSLAQPSPGVLAYVQSQQSAPLDDDTALSGSPFRVVLSSRDPFHAKERLLPPELTIELALPPGVKDPQPGKPLTLRGKLTRKAMTGRHVIRTEPMAGVPVELRHATKSSFQPTPYRGVTGADGTYEIVVPAAKDASFTAVAATPGAETWAGPALDSPLGS